MGRRPRVGFQSAHGAALACRDYSAGHSARLGHCRSLSAGRRERRLRYRAAIRRHDRCRRALAERRLFHRFPLPAEHLHRPHLYRLLAALNAEGRVVEQHYAGLIPEEDVWKGLFVADTRDGAALHRRHPAHANRDLSPAPDGGRVPPGDAGRSNICTPPSTGGMRFSRTATISGFRLPRRSASGGRRA